MTNNHHQSPMTNNHRKQNIQAATLRVLSYTSPSFEQLCQPRMLRQVIIIIMINIIIITTNSTIIIIVIIVIIIKKNSLQCDRDHLTIL